MIDPISLATVLTSLIPTISYVTKRIVDYKTGGNKPANASEYVEARKADNETLEIINRTPENISRWVANIIALQRPLVVYTVLFNWTLVTLGLVHVDLQVYVILANLASSIMFYLFGDRSLMYSLEANNKKLLGK